MVSRGRRPSLIGRTAQTVARTAVIAGTATAVSGMVAGRQGAASPPPDAPPPPATAASAAMSDTAIDQLKKLAELRAAGVLTEEEFNAQKARLLA
jgi:hypothetical protein